MWPKHYRKGRAIGCKRALHGCLIFRHAFEHGAYNLAQYSALLSMQKYSCSGADSCCPTNKTYFCFRISYSYGSGQWMFIEHFVDKRSSFLSPMLQYTKLQDRQRKFHSHIHQYQFILQRWVCGAVDGIVYCRLIVFRGDGSL